MPSTSEPIVRLIVRLQQAGQDVTMAAGYMQALWHEVKLDSHTAPLQLGKVRDAAHTILAAVRYENAQKNEASNTSEAA